jgi:hypothetical protein
LLGRVVREDGTPVTNATVFIYSAAPKQGTGALCPSCYADCAKTAKTAADGTFIIESLDPDLIFRLLVVAPGCESTFVGKTDPAEGRKEIKLTRLSEAKLKSPSRIAGVVINEKGEPLVGATIEPEGVTYGPGMTSWGGTERYVDPVAVTDERGRFWLFCTNDVQLVHAVVEARGVAKRRIGLKPGRDHLVRMEEGVTVKGAVFRDGKPAPGVVLGLVSADRTCGNFLRCDEQSTDEDGWFLFPNVPPLREFVLYSTMSSLGGKGVIPSKGFTTGPTGSEKDLGKIELQPGFRVAGRVVLSDGKPVPDQTRIFLWREKAWDHAEAVLDAGGRFEFRGVPAEPVGLNVRIKGYKFSKRNPSLDWLNGGLVGRVDGDITDLTLLMEPGEWRYDGEEGGAPDGESQPREKPLRGVRL